MLKTNYFQRNVLAIISVLVISLMTGCISNNIVIDSVHSWEGHYFTSESAQEAVKQINLKKGESVWILSDKTLNRVLKNVQK